MLMNARSLLILTGILCWPLVGRAAIPGYSPMKVIQTDNVVYPAEATQLGIISGQVTVAVQIDETGKLADLLVVSYTHPKFAERAVNALKRWRYEPAYIDGAPRSATAELAFNFETQGIVVVNLDVNSYMEQRNYQLRPSAFSYRACRLRDLDRIPTPTKVVQPNYSEALAKTKQSPVVVTVHFYIDEHGHVRLPAVSRESSQGNEVLAAAALDAVSQWEFEPPLSHGQPVLVSARQDFNFVPVATAKSSEPSQAPTKSD